LSQIGEFSFIVGQAGLNLGVLDQTQYSLILASSIVSITLNPLMFKLVGPAERFLRRWPRVWERLNRHGPEVERPERQFAGHVVIVGCGRVGRHVAEVLGRIGVPRLVVEVDPFRTKRLQELGIPVLFGDAANSEILTHTGLPRARSLVVTVSDDVSSLMIVTAGRRLGPQLQIIVRASTWDGARRLRAAGATAVIRPELEGGIAIVEATLRGLEFSTDEAQRHTDAVRQTELGGDDVHAR
jgi:CPA2 family monovalent cation:H+ antiporter-2